MNSLLTDIEENENWIENIKKELNWNELHEDIDKIEISSKTSIKRDDNAFSLLLKHRLGYTDQQCSRLLSTPEHNWSISERSLMHNYVIGEARRLGLPTTIVGSEFTAIKIPKKKFESLSQSKDNRKRQTYRAKTSEPTYTESLRELIALQNDYTLKQYNGVDGEKREDGVASKQVGKDVVETNERLSTLLENNMSLQRDSSRTQQGNDTSERRWNNRKDCSTTRHSRRDSSPRSSHREDRSSRDRSRRERNDSSDHRRCKERKRSRSRNTHYRNVNDSRRSYGRSDSKENLINQEKRTYFYSEECGHSRAIGDNNYEADRKYKQIKNDYDEYIIKDYRYMHSGGDGDKEDVNYTKSSEKKSKKHKKHKHRSHSHNSSENRT